MKTGTAPKLFVVIGRTHPELPYIVACCFDEKEARGQASLLNKDTVHVYEERADVETDTASTEAQQFEHSTTRDRLLQLYAERPPDITPPNNDDTWELVSCIAWVKDDIVHIVHYWKRAR